MNERNLFDAIFAPDLFLGVCDECRQAKSFSTERDRELWQKFHPHDEDDA